MQSQSKEFSLIDKVPCCPEIEKIVLGEILIDGSSFKRVKDIINSHDFFMPNNKVLFKALEDISTKGSSISEPIILDYLKTNNIFEKIGGDLFFNQLQQMFATGPTVEECARKIKDRSTKRKLLELFIQAISKLKEDLPDTNEDLDRIVSKINLASQQSVGDTSQTLGEVCRDVLLDLITKPSQALMTGFPKLDEITHGIHLKDLIILAAETSMGKTTFAWYLALNIAANGYPITFLTLEMSKKEMARKAISIFSGETYENIETCNFSSESFKLFEQACENYDKLSIHLEEKNMDIYEIKRVVRDHVIRYGVKLVVVDHLHFMKRNTNSENRYSELTIITGELKALAKELDIAIIALSQLSRAGSTRLDRRPQKSDLRDSGSIEQDADVILFLYREGVIDREKDPRLAEVIVSKNRHGEGNKTVHMIFEGATCSMYENECQTFSQVPEQQVVKKSKYSNYSDRD